MISSLKKHGLLIVAFIALNMISKKFGNLYFENELTNYLIYKSLTKIVLSSIAISALIKLRLYSFIDLNKNKLVSIILITLLLLLSLIYVTNNLEIPIWNESHLLLFISTLSTGIFEEIFNRLLVFGLIYCWLTHTKLTDKRFFAVLYSSLFFGLLHLTNLADADYDKLSVINQAVLATGIGFLLQSILIKMQNIGLIIFLHSLMNYVGSYRIIQDFNSNDQSKFAEMTSLEIGLNLMIFLAISGFILFLGKVILNSVKYPLRIRCNNVA